MLLAWRARKAVARLTQDDVTATEIMAAAHFGRAGLHELFRLFGESPAAPLREAAGCAIASLWAQDQLIAEEEQALVRRGYAVTWKARRRYPRAIRTEIPITVTYGLPFLNDHGSGVKPANLEWSHRVMGTRRASLEGFSHWSSGAGRLEFGLIPGDFETNGPHRLVLHTRVRTTGLTEAWQIELPQIPFNIEFDTRLEVGSLLTLPDDTRGQAMAQAVRLERTHPAENEPSRFLTLNEALTVRNPPQVVVSTPLPCDLAHKAHLELDGVAGRYPAGLVLLSGQGGSREGDMSTVGRSHLFGIGPVAPISPDAIDRPGIRRMRIILSPDPDLGWTDPEVRSIWPGIIETNWVEVELMRR